MEIREIIRCTFITVLCMFLFYKKPEKAENNREFNIKTAKFMQFMFNSDYLKYTDRKMKYDVKIQFANKLYIEDFAKETDIEMSPIRVAGFTDKQGDAIVLDEQIWDMVDYNQNLATVYHELGHAKLNRSHVKAIAIGIPASLMYHSSFSSEVFGKLSRYYVKEMFVVNYLYNDGSGRNLNDILYNPPVKCDLEAR